MAQVSQPTPSALYKAAKELVAEGQPVFPCFPSGERAKRPMTKNGFNGATTDLAQIKRWWRANGDAAIGIPTGVVWDVFDIDTKNGKDGRQYLPLLLRHGLLNGCQRLVRSPSGGWHLYFKSTPGLRNKSRNDLGLDVRATGGYVLAPPSWVDDNDKSIGPYVRWDDPEGATDEPLLWDMIVNTIAPVNEDTNEPIPLPSLERQASIAGLKAWMFDRQKGERNNALHWATRRCLDHGIDPNELEEVALYIGLGAEEVKATIDGAIKRTGFNVSELLSEAEAQFGTD